MNSKDSRERRRRKEMLKARSQNSSRTGGAKGRVKSPRAAAAKKTKARPERLFARSNRSKLLIVFCAMVVLLCALVVRLTYINATSGGKYQKKVLSQLNYNSTTIPYRRGDITDRNGTVLATSEKVYNLILDSYVLTNSRVKTLGDCVDPTLDVLEEYFGLDPKEVKAVIDENPESRYRVMLRQLTYEEVLPYETMMNSEEDVDEQISRFVKGIWFEDDYVRRYPYNTLACDALGFTVSGNVGTYGIEQYYNDTLNGTNGREYGYLEGGSSLQRTTVAPVNGENVRSTIDVNIQRIVEDVIWEYNEAIGSKNTAVVVMDPNNGEILAMASYPVFDLNNPRDLSGYYSEEELREMTSEQKMLTYNYLWRNYCISDPYEPGSTAKPMIVALALDENEVETDTTFICDGGQAFKDGAGKVYVDCNATHYQLDLAGSLMHSCNDAMMDIAERCGVEAFVKSQEVFNLGQSTGIDLPGEADAATLLYYEDNMGPVELATNAFGQGYSATVIQMAAAFCSIINGGYYYEPHMVKEIYTESGSTVETVEAELVRTTTSEETSQWMRETLLATVEEGSAKPVFIEGYAIGAKTGTAQKRPLSERKNIVSLMSCAPAENPEVVVYVVIDEPQIERQDNSGLASIMSRKIYEELLPYLQIFPESEEDDGTSILDDPVETEAETEAESATEASAEESGETQETDDQGAVIEENDSVMAGQTGEKTVWKHMTDDEKYEIALEYKINPAQRLKPTYAELMDYASGNRRNEPEEEPEEESVSGFFGGVPASETDEQNSGQSDGADQSESTADSESTGGDAAPDVSG